jgi:NSS family neurotransmitter:Na+ symporter
MAMHTVTVAALAGVLVFGIRRGIERVVKWMIPILVVALIAISVRGLTLPGGTEGLAFAFTPDLEALTRGSTWVAALGQALFSTGLGWGIALTYGSYLGRYDDVPLGGGLFTAVGNTSIGLLAIFATVPVVFAFGLEPSAGSELAFVSLVQVFPQLPGGAGWAIAFFVSFFFATFTSGLGITEVGVTTVAEETRLSRRGAVLAVCGAIWLLGLPSAYSSSFLGQMDFVFGNFGLPLATLAIITLVGWKFAPERARAIDLNRNAGVYVGSWWNLIVRYVVPVVMAFIIGYGAYTSIGTDDQAIMLGGIAVMAVLVVASAAVMNVLGTADGTGEPARPKGGD